MIRLKLDESPGPALVALLRRHLAGTAKGLAAAAADGKVHGLRKRLKFERSLLRLLRPAVPKAEFHGADRLLRDAARRLATARHAEALQEAIGKLEAGAARDGLAHWAAAIHSREHAAGDVEKAAQAARDLVLRARKAAARWKLPRQDRLPAVQGLRGSYAKARRGLARGLRSGDNGTLHEARKAVIHHLHQLEIVENLWPQLIRTWVAELTRLREALGDLNDLEELGKRLRGDPVAASEDGAAAIARRRAALLASIRLLAGQLFAETPKAMARRLAALWDHALQACETPAGA